MATEQRGLVYSSHPNFICVAKIKTKVRNFTKIYGDFVILFGDESDSVSEHTVPLSFQ